MWITVKIVTLFGVGNRKKKNVLKKHSASTHVWTYYSLSNVIKWKLQSMIIVKIKMKNIEVQYIYTTIQFKKKDREKNISK
jgi:hypothetical protein